MPGYTSKQSTLTEPIMVLSSGKMEFFYGSCFPFLTVTPGFKGFPIKVSGVDLRKVLSIFRKAPGGNDRVPGFVLLPRAGFWRVRSFFQEVR